MVSSYIHHRIDEPLKNLRLYCNLTEDHLSSLSKEVEDTPFNDDNILDWISNSVTYSVELTTILRHSLLVSLYSYFENQLILLCKSIQFHNNIILSVTEIRGSGIEKAQIYIKKVLELNVPDDTVEWQFVIRCNLIRNCIVHCGGDVDLFPQKKELRRLIEETSSIYEGPNNRIVLSKEFLYKIMDCVETILKSLYINAKETNLLY